MANDHKEEKDKVEAKYGKSNVLWGDEVSNLGIVAAGLAAYFGVSAGYAYFAQKLNNFKQFGLDAAKFLATKGNPNHYRLYFGYINIDHWDEITNPITGKKKKIYFKRSYRYYMAIKK